jgi:hypothetical protein
VLECDVFSLFSFFPHEVNGCNANSLPILSLGVCGWILDGWITQDFQIEPFVPVRSVRPEHSSRALLQLCDEVKRRTKGKGLDLLIAILPDNNGALYGT